MPNIIRTIAAFLANRRRNRLANVLELCDRMDADAMNGGVVLTSAVRAVATGSSAAR